ncbi:hypothetical protein COF68_05045 [Bacillus toyonensis]|uniref:hypothetical protein n=1 Tax=Bacillus toyonensis TaxID=155322 RepID=UPI000BFB90C3|nr:hypothetical protein [Bacillus toyonensis]PHE64213.1 hypothetical protein COF68_05045 [Bacillus toyonensis]
MLFTVKHFYKAKTNITDFILVCDRDNDNVLYTFMKEEDFKSWIELVGIEIPRKKTITNGIGHMGDPEYRYRVETYHPHRYFTALAYSTKEELPNGSTPTVSLLEIDGEGLDVVFESHVYVGEHETALYFPKKDSKAFVVLPQRDYHISKAI